jgi:hypothetical protein
MTLCQIQNAGPLAKLFICLIIYINGFGLPTYRSAQAVQHAICILEVPRLSFIPGL